MIKYVGVFILAFLLYLPLCFSHNLWVDELFTMRMVQESFMGIIHETIVQDTHTPFYYLFLKGWMLLFGSHSPIVGRFFSFFWLLMTLGLGIFPIRRLFGDKTALTFIFLTLFLPVSLYIGVDIRMYSMALFFMTGLTVYAIAILRTNQTSDKLIFSIMTLGALYCHYYTTMGTGIIYAFLGIMLMLKNRSLYRGFLWFWISVFINALLFLPWLIVFFQQTASVYDTWWVTTNSIPGVFSFLTKPKVWLPLSACGLVVFGIFVTLFWGTIVGGLIFSKKLFSKQDRIIFFLLPTVFLTVLSISILISYTLRPMLIWRYTIPFFGLFYLAVAMCLAKITFLRRIILVLSFVVCCFAWPQAKNRMYDPTYDTLVTKFQELPNNTLFAAPNTRIYMWMKHYLPNRPVIQLYMKNEQVFFNNLKERKKLLNAFKNKKYQTITIMNDAGECDHPLKTLYYPNVEYCLFRLTPELFNLALMRQTDNSKTP